MRIFIEGVDSYVGRAVQRQVEAFFKSSEQEEDAGEEEGEEKKNKYEIVGSLSSPASAEEPILLPPGVSEAFSRADLDSICSLARSADLIVLDSHCSIQEASLIVKSLKRPFQGNKSLVLISTLLTWDRTPKQISSVEGKEEDEEGDDAEGGEKLVKFREEEFTRRKASPAFLLHKTLESQVLALAHANLSTTVLAAGLIYGEEEGLFHSFFREAWLGRSPKVLDLNEGCSNVLPTVHVNDLAKACWNALNTPPSQQYVVVTDQATDSLKDIITAIFSVLQPHQELTLLSTTSPVSVPTLDQILRRRGDTAADDNADEELSEEEIEERKNGWKKFMQQGVIASKEETEELMVRDASWNHLQCNLAFDTTESTVEKLVGEDNQEWVARDGLVANIHQVVKEFRAARDLRPVKLVVMGPPKVGKTTLAQSAAKEYSLPLVSQQGAVDELLLRLSTTRAEREERLESYRARRAEEKAAKLAAKANESKEEGKESEEDGEGDQEEEEEELKEEDDVVFQDIMRKSAVEKLAERVETCLEKKKKVSNKLAAKALRVKLFTPECLNHGYVLDANDLSYAGLKRVYGMSLISDGLYDPDQDSEDDSNDGAVAQDADLEDEDDDIALVESKTTDEQEGQQEEESNQFRIDSRIAPSAVVVLDADDQVLYERARTATDGNAVSKEAFEALLENYRKRNADHLVHTPRSFFEGYCRLETLSVQTDQPLHFESSSGSRDSESKEVDPAESKESKEEESKTAAESNQNGSMDSQTFENVLLYIEQGGRPFNYHPTEEEVLERQAIAMAEQLEREEKERRLRIEVETKRKAEEAERLQALEEHREQVARHEEELLQARSEPLRDYLLKHVMPTLSKGLVETCRVKPDDPIDFLAEYLFKNSSENETL